MTTIKKYTVQELSHKAYMNAISNQAEYLIECDAINEFLENDVENLLFNSLYDEGSINDVDSPISRFNWLQKNVNDKRTARFPDYEYDGSDYGFRFNSKDLSEPMKIIEKSISKEVIDLYSNYLDDYNVHFTIDPDEKQFDVNGDFID